MTRKKRFRLAFYLSAFALLVFGADTRLNVVHYEIQSGKIHAPVRIVLIADLHSCHYGEGQKTLVDAIDREKPDLILYAGDILDDVLPDGNAIVLLEAMQGKYPAYYVTGNHEFWSDDVRGKIAVMRRHGVKVLQGECDTITVNGQTLNICGVDDPDVDAYTTPLRSFSEQLSSLRNAADNGAYTILLSHRPELIAEYAAYPFDLVLSGHSHGGQWRIPKLLNGVYSPNQGFFPKYPGGKYAHDDVTLLVSRGLAKESTRIPRLYNRPELVVIDL